MSLADIVVIGLATWRLSYLLSEENGPGDVVRTLRRAIGAESPDEGFLGALFGCVLCLSAWVMVPIIALYLGGGEAGRTAVEVLAIWGVAAAIHLNQTRL